MCVEPGVQLDRIRNFLESELDRREKEQEFLKTCQLRYFVVSITISGTYIGVMKLLAHNPRFDEMLQNAPIVFLSPLIFLIPVWLVYFDKAKTIARIVGYKRVLEYLILRGTNEEIVRFEGWERSLGRFRSDYETDNLTRDDNPRNFSTWTQIKKILLLESTHKYWIMHYYFFSGASVITLLTASGFHGIRTAVFWIAAVIVLLTILYTGVQLRRLIYGRNGYDAHEKKWKEQLVLQYN